MALRPTPVVFDVTLSHVDKGATTTVTLRTAQHPSETAERLWLRVLAYLWQYDERLRFSAELCEGGDTPDLVGHDDRGEVIAWVQVGKPEPKRIQRAVDHHPQAQVAVLFESPFRLRRFLKSVQSDGIERTDKAELATVSEEFLRELAARGVGRAKLGVTVVGDHFYIECEGATIEGPLLRPAALAEGTEDRS